MQTKVSEMKIPKGSQQKLSDKIKMNSPKGLKRTPQQKPSGIPKGVQQPDGTKSTGLGKRKVVQQQPGKIGRAHD